jgi:23S rRNA (guanosine2251-2'-O)-methyltransferase
MTKKLKTRELNRLTEQEYQMAEKSPIVVVLDNVRSAYNTGSVFRTCDGFRVSKIMLCGITSQPPHREIHKTAIGAENTVEWNYFEDTKECIEQLKNEGYRIIGIEQTSSSKSLLELNWESGTKIGIVLGNEVDGLSENIINMCDEFIEIPQFGTKHSLNVSVAAGIVLWELTRLKLKND